MSGRSILIRFLGDSSSAKKASQETEQALGKVAPAADKVTKSTDKLSGSQKALASTANVAQKSINGLASIFTSRMGPAGSELQKTIEKATAGLGRNLPAAGSAAARGLGEAEQGAASVAATVGSAVPLATAAAAAGLAKMAVAGIKSQTDLVGSVIKIQRATGETVEQASLLNGEFRRSGVDVDSATSGLNRFAVNLDKSKATLQGLGVQIHLNTDGTVNYSATLDGLRQQYQATDDSSARARLAQAAFGKGFQDMGPWLSKSTEQLKAYDAETRKDHGVVTEKQKADVVAFNNTMRELGQTWQGLERELASGMIPTVTAFATALTDAAHAGDELTKVLPKIHLAGQSFSPSDLINPVALLGKAYGATKTQIQGAAGATVDLSDKMVSSAQSAQNEADKIAEDAQAVDSLKSATQGLISADKSLDDAHTNLTKATSTLAEKQAALAELQAKPLVDIKAVAAAERSLADAQVALADKQEAYQTLLHKAVVDEKAVADATKARERSVRSMQDALNAQLDAEKALYAIEHPNARSLTDAKLDVTQAQNDATRAMMAQSLAHQALQKLESSGRGTADQLAQARLDASDADIAATRASERLTDAEKAAYDLTPTGIRLTDQYKQATKAVTDAKQASADAADAERQADTALATAKLGDTNRTKELRDAERELRDAQDNVKKSTDDLATARLGDTNRAKDLKTAADDVRAAEDGVKAAQDAIPAAAYAAATAQDAFNAAMKAGDQIAASYRQQLQQLYDQYPEARGFIQGQLDAVPALPGGTYTTAQAHGNSYKPGGEINAFASGGMVPGPTGRPQLAIVHGGERVLTPEEQAGGGVGLPRRGGAVIPSAAGVASGGGVVVQALHVHVNGTGNSGRELVDLLRNRTVRQQVVQALVGEMTTEQVRNRKRSGAANL